MNRERERGRGRQIERLTDGEKMQDYKENVMATERYSAGKKRKRKKIRGREIEIHGTIRLLTVLPSSQES